MKHAIVLFCFVLTISTLALGNSWVARYKGPSSLTDTPTDIAVDSSGYVYVTGARYNFETDYDIATIKYDPNGNEVWESFFNSDANDYDKGNAIALDSSGNIYVTGISYTDSNTFTDYIIIKYDPNGGRIWVRTYNGTLYGDDEATAIAIDSSNNIYITGSSKGDGTEQDFATIKYNSSGTQQWVRRYNNSSANNWDNAKAIVIDSSNNVYVTGSSNNADYTRDIVTIKYSSAGTTYWTKRYNRAGDQTDEAFAIARDSSNNIYVAGRSYGTSDDYVTIKYTSSGTESWARFYNSTGDGYDTANAIAVDSSSNIFVTGSSYTGSSNDYATVKYNSSGTEQWVSVYDGPSGEYDEAHSIATDTSGNIYVTGLSYGAATNADYATIKYTTDGNEVWVARYNGPVHGYDYAIKLILDDSANVYVTGISDGINSGGDFLTIKNPNLVGYCSGPLQGDYNFDCKVDIQDFAIFATGWLSCNIDPPSLCW